MSLCSGTNPVLSVLPLVYFGQPSFTRLVMQIYKLSALTFNFSSAAAAKLKLHLWKSGVVLGSRLLFVCCDLAASASFRVSCRQPQLRCVRALLPMSDSLLPLPRLGSPTLSRGRGFLLFVSDRLTSKLFHFQTCHLSSLASLARASLLPGEQQRRSPSLWDLFFCEFRILES